MAMEKLNEVLVDLALRKQEFKSRTLFTNEEGQGMVEYGLIIALVSVVAIVALRLIGTNILDVFNGVAGDLTGAEGGN